MDDEIPAKEGGFMSRMKAIKKSIATFQMDDENAFTSTHVLDEPQTEIANEEGRYHVDKVMSAFEPLRILLIAVARFPFVHNIAPDGSCEFLPLINSFRGYYFLTVAILIFYALIFGTIHLFAVVIEETSFEEKEPMEETEFPEEISSIKNITIHHNKYENAILKRHVVSLIVLYASLINAAIASWAIMYKRNFIATYLSFWTRAVLTIHMDMSGHTRKFIILGCAVVASCNLLLAFVGMLSICPTAVGSASLTAILMFKFFLPYGWLNADFLGFVRGTFQILGGFTFVMTLLASKSVILLFFFTCRLLRSAFANWNGRLYASIFREDEIKPNENDRTTYVLLFKDHCILLDLLEGTDRVFAGIIESYLGLEVFAICFEFYFFIRTAKFGNKTYEAYVGGYFIRPFDWVVGLVILFQSLFLIVIVTSSAAYVGEEAIGGLEILRRKTMLGRKTNEELYFMLSMFASYTAYKKLELNGGGYFYMNKGFIIGVMSTVFSYFIILYQFQPILDENAGFNSTDRELLGKFFAKSENLKPEHYLPSN